MKLLCNSLTGNIPKANEHQVNHHIVQWLGAPNRVSHKPLDIQPPNDPPSFLLGAVSPPPSSRWVYGGEYLVDAQGV
jgi:hypothetical protein